MKRLRVPVSFRNAMRKLTWKQIAPSTAEQKLWRARSRFGDWYVRQLAANVFAPDRVRSDGQWSSGHAFSFMSSAPRQCATLLQAKAAVSQFMRDRIVATAYHEAGHLLAALHFGLPLSRGAAASVIPDGRSHGHVSLRDGELVIGGKIESRSLLENYCVSYLAGRAADIVCRGEWSEMGAGGSCGSDYASVNLILGMITAHQPSEWGSCGFFDDELKAYLLVLELRAARLVKDNWKSIEALACALLDRGTLSAAEAKDVLE
jgi:hypothetical protein